jgi:hypothetical protein
MGRCDAVNFLALAFLIVGDRTEGNSRMKDPSGALATSRTKPVFKSLAETRAEAMAAPAIDFTEHFRREVGA